MEEIDESRAKATVSEHVNANPSTELSHKPSIAKEEGELSSDEDDDDVLLSKSLVHTQTICYFFFPSLCFVLCFPSSSMLDFVFTCHFSSLGLCLVAEKTEENRGKHVFVPIFLSLDNKLPSYRFSSIKR